MRNLLFLLFLFLSSSVFSQVEFSRTICQKLTDKTFYGRGYIKSGDSLAAKYIANEFAKLRVQSLGKYYFQNFSFPVNTFPTDVHLRINGRELELGKDYLPHEASGPSKGSWHFRVFDSLEWNNREILKNVTDSLQDGYYNAVVMDVSGLSSHDEKYANDLISVFVRFGNILKIVDKKIDWSVSTQQFPFSYWIVQKSVLPKHFLSIEAEITPKFVKEHQTKNIVAYIPAKKKAKKQPYLFFTAHYDHLGGIGEQVYFPGASDNASGVSMLLSLAKYYKEHASKYNIAFIAFAGEEAGLIGSQYYVEHPIIPLEKIKFLVNLDLMGNGEDGITVVNGSIYPKQFKLLQIINKEKNYLPVINSRGKAANSDHYFFTEAGVPSFFIYTLGKNKNYHDIYDIYKDLSFAKFNEIVDLLTDFVGRLE